MTNFFSRTSRVLLLLALPFLAQAQTGSVGVGTTAPNASAALDVVSSSKGLLPPRLSTAQRDAIASPAAGLTLYNTTTNKLNTWNGTAWAESLTTTEQARQSAAVTFTYTGAAQTYTVPAGVTSLSVVALGGQGGIGVNGTTNPNGGGGGRVSATLAVTPGEMLTITVGGQGGAGTFGAAAGGFNGAGTGYNGGGGGGGATDLRRGGAALANRILVAAGGGGAASPSSSNSDGGAGGGLTGATGGDGGYGPNAPGTGATQTAGGSAGGGLGIGGNAAAAGPGACGGGGGGGYYGGGGARQAASAGGGGGSSFVQVAGSTNTVHTAGSGTGNGSLTITIPEYAAPALDGTNFVNVPGTWQVNGADVYRNTGSVGIGTATPAASAALDVSTTSKGLLPPRLSTAQRNAIASPAAGLTVYNTTTGKLNVWNGTAWDANLSATEQPSPASAVTFTYTGAAQTYTVPAGVTSLSVVALGGQGGIGASGINTYPNGGGGGRVNATLTVTPGEILTITVGGQGAAGTSGTSAGGFNGGGTGYNGGGGGGGATDLRRSGTALANRILVAAGGGGASVSSFGSEGGAGGGSTGATGGNGGYGPNAPGTGATQTVGGSVGGNLGAGGNAVTTGGTVSACGGGGGGGYYGGGGAQQAVPAGGGGGSSFVQVAGSTGTVYTAGSGTGNGLLTITITGYAAPAFDGTNFVNVPGTWTESGPNVYRGSGNVGIGTSTPTQKLDVAGNAAIGGNVGLGTSAPLTRLSISPSAVEPKITLYDGGTTANHYGFGVSGGQLNYHVFTAADRHVFYAGGKNGDGTELLRIQGDGKVGIGTTNPAFPLDVQSTVTPANYAFVHYARNGSTSNIGFAGNNTGPVSIRATGEVVAAQFNAVSDRRLKTVVGRSDRGADLVLLNQLRITDYTMRDRVQFGSRAFKKVIAQEVEGVFPQAVQQHVGFLPDIYALATAVQALPGDSLVTLTLPAGLLTAATTGQRLKLVGEHGDVPAALARPAAAGARTLVLRRAQALAGSKVFVFGLEHADVRAVDYEALSMLNVSATQELARKVAALEQQNAALQGQNGQLRQQQQAQATRLDQQQASLSTLQEQVARLLGEGTQARK